MKRSAFCLLLVCVLVITLAAGITVSASQSSKAIKRVVSIVYDDSGSMNNKNEDWAYASYALQNLISLLNEQDELCVVKTSAPTQTVSVQLGASNRVNEIKAVESWAAYSDTPFATVQTAVDWLEERHRQNSDDQAIEYWLVVITDGQFENGYPDDMTKYLTDIRESMGDSKYEGVFVAIGNNVPSKAKTDWTSVTGNHMISASNSQQIVEAMSEVSGLILGQGGKEANVTVSLGTDGKSITFTSYFPLRKFIVYEQGQSAAIVSIATENADAQVTADFSSHKPGAISADSRTIHCESASSDFIPAGKTTVTFENKIDVSAGKLKILTESAVSINLALLDAAGQPVSDLSNAGFAEGDCVTYCATVSSCIDGSTISLKSWANSVVAELVVNDVKSTLTYDSESDSFRGTYVLEDKETSAYSVVTLPGYFRAKSDIVCFTPAELVKNADTDISASKIDIVYKYCEKYEPVSTLKYTLLAESDMTSICAFTFHGLPAGVTASVDGVCTDENGMLTIEVDDNVPLDLVFYRNKDYTETEPSTVTIEVRCDERVIDWTEDSITEVVLNPVPRKLTVEAQQREIANNIKLNQFDDTVIYDISILADNDYLSAEELRSMKISFAEYETLGFRSEIEETDGHGIIHVICSKEAPDLKVKTGAASTSMSASTVYTETAEPVLLQCYIHDSLLKYTIPFLLLLLLIIAAGYLPIFKKRIHKKEYYIEMDNTAEDILIKKATRILPYVTEQGFAGDLNVVATSRKSKLLANVENMEHVQLNGEVQEPTSKQVPLCVDDVLAATCDGHTTTYILRQSSDAQTYDSSFGDDEESLFGDDSLNQSSDDDISIF